MSSAVHFRFKSAKDFESATFEGDFLKVADLKLAIVERKKLNFGEGFDLEISDAQTKEVFFDENALVQKNASVVVRRVPGLKPGGVLSHQDMAKKNERYAEKEKEPSALLGVGDLTAPPVLQQETVEGADEAARIANIIGQAATAFDNVPPPAWGRGRYGRGGAFRGNNRGGFRGRGGRGQFSGPPPSANYVCHRCNKPGHWIVQCPTNGDPAYDKIKVRAPTGIPRSMLRNVDAPETGTGLQDSSGQFVTLRPNEEEFARQTVGLRMSHAAAAKMAALPNSAAPSAPAPPAAAPAAAPPAPSPPGVAASVPENTTDPLPSDTRKPNEQPQEQKEASVSTPPVGDGAPTGIETPGGSSMDVGAASKPTGDSHRGRPKGFRVPLNGRNNTNVNNTNASARLNARAPLGAPPVGFPMPPAGIMPPFPPPEFFAAMAAQGLPGFLPPHMPTPLPTPFPNTGAAPPPPPGVDPAQHQIIMAMLQQQAAAAQAQKETLAPTQDEPSRSTANEEANARPKKAQRRTPSRTPPRSPARSARWNSPGGGFRGSPRRSSRSPARFRPSSPRRFRDEARRSRSPSPYRRGSRYGRRHSSRTPSPRRGARGSRPRSRSPSPHRGSYSSRSPRSRPRSPSRRWGRNSPPRSRSPLRKRTPPRTAGRSRSPRRSPSPASRWRRSPPRAGWGRRSSKTGRGGRSPSRESRWRSRSPGRRASPAGRGGLGSPSRRRSPLRRASPGRRASPRRRVSPWRRASPSRRSSPSRRASPSRRLSPGRRTSPSRRVSLSRTGSPARRRGSSRDRSPRRVSYSPAGRRKGSPYSRRSPGRRRSPDRVRGSRAGRKRSRSPYDRRRRRSFSRERMPQKYSSGDVRKGYTSPLGRRDRLSPSRDGKRSAVSPVMESVVSKPKTVVSKDVALDTTHVSDAMDVSSKEGKSTSVGPTDAEKDGSAPATVSTSLVTTKVGDGGSPSQNRKKRSSPDPNESESRSKRPRRDESADDGRQDNRRSIHDRLGDKSAGKKNSKRRPIHERLGQKY